MTCYVCNLKQNSLVYLTVLCFIPPTQESPKKGCLSFSSARRSIPRPEDKHFKGGLCGAENTPKSALPKIDLRAHTQPNSSLANARNTSLIILLSKNMCMFTEKQPLDCHNASGFFLSDYVVPPQNLTGAAEDILLYFLHMDFLHALGTNAYGLQVTLHIHFPFWLWQSSQTWVTQLVGADSQICENRFCLQDYIPQQGTRSDFYIDVFTSSTP